MSDSNNRSPSPTAAPGPGLLSAWLAQSHDLLALTDAAGRIQWCNPAFERSSGIGVAAELAAYLKDGRMKSKEDVVVGMQTFPEALLKLFNGENFGKLVLQFA